MVNSELSSDTQSHNIFFFHYSILVFDRYFNERFSYGNYFNYLFIQLLFIVIDINVCF